MSRRLVDDIIHDILPRLRGKDLLRFRCLSKSLCNKIESPAFTAAHFHRSMETKTGRKLVFQCGSHEYGWIDLDDDVDNHRVIKLNNPYPYDCNYQIICPCHGLILLFNARDGTLAIWNPLTRRSKRVPSCRVELNKDTYVGFVYVDDKYKVVTLDPSKVRVFDVASNTWSEVLVENPFHNPNLHMPTGILAEFANGALHWLVATDSWSIRVISFDISKQRYAQTLLNLLPNQISPHSNLSLRVSNLSLRVLQGRLFLCIMDSIALGLYEAVDEGQGFIWRNLFKVDIWKLNEMVGTNYDDVPILEYSKDGNKILLEVQGKDGTLLSRYLCWYDLQRGTYKPIQTLGNRTLQYFFDPAICWESIVSLGDD